MGTSTRFSSDADSLHSDHDLSLCREVLSELRGLAEKCREGSQRAHQASAKLTLQMVALFCDGGMQAVHHFIELSLQQSVSPTLISHEVPEHPGLGDSTEPEWRPGEDISEPMD